MNEDEQERGDAWEASTDGAPVAPTLGERIRAHVALRLREGWPDSAIEEELVVKFGVRRTPLHRR